MTSVSTGAGVFAAAAPELDEEIGLAVHDLRHVGESRRDERPRRRFGLDKSWGWTFPQLWSMEG
jgi:hypothetical protein